MATVAEAVDLKTYNETYLECRDLRHAWRLLGFYKQGSGQLGRRLACTRCNTVRHDIWSNSGERIKAQYDYVDGYSLKGSGGIEQHDVRREQIRRANVQGVFRTEDELIEAVYTGNGRIRRTA